MHSAMASCPAFTSHNVGRDSSAPTRYNPLRKRKGLGMGFIGMQPEPLTPRGRAIVLTAVILALLFIVVWGAGIVLMLHNPGQGSICLSGRCW